MTEEPWTVLMVLLIVLYPIFTYLLFNLAITASQALAGYRAGIASNPNVWSMLLSHAIIAAWNIIALVLSVAFSIFPIFMVLTVFRTEFGIVGYFLTVGWVLFGIFVTAYLADKRLSNPKSPS